MPSFVYDVSIYRITKDSASLVDQQLYSSNKLLDIKDDTIITKYRGNLLVKYIDIIGVPEEFVKNQDLKLYNSQIINRKRK